MPMTPKEHQIRAAEHAAHGTSDMAIYHTLTRVAEALEGIDTTLESLHDARSLEGVVAGIADLVQATYSANP